MSSERHRSRTAGILANKRLTEITPEDWEIAAREHALWLRERTQANSLRQFKEIIKPALDAGEELQRINPKGRVRVPRFTDRPHASVVVAPSNSAFLPNRPCVTQTFQWPIPAGQTSPLNALPPDSATINNTNWVTFYQEAIPQTGALLAGAAGGQTNRFFNTPPTIRFNNQPLDVTEQSIATATLSNYFEAPAGTSLSVYARMLVTVDPPNMAGLARPDTALVFFDELEPGQDLFAYAEAVLTVGAIGVDQTFTNHIENVPMFSGHFTNGFEPPFYFVGREVWLNQTVQLTSVPLPNSARTLYYVAVSLNTLAWASPVDDGPAHIAVVDLRGTPPGVSGLLGAISPSNPYKIVLAELRLQACGRNPTAF